MPVTPDAFVRPNPFDALAGSEGDPALPAYTAAPDDGATLESLAARTDLRLPLERAPRRAPMGRERRLAAATETAIVAQFFKATTDEDVDTLRGMVGAGLVSPDVASAAGMTPLAYAAREGRLRSAQALLELGADVNALCDTALPPNAYARKKATRALRTPLMAAAAAGRLPMAQLLLANGADDGVVAPDGQIALRLAADGGHRELVALLPARRAGAGLRLKEKWRPVWAPLRSVARFAWFFVWDVPKFLLWSVPKHCVVLPLYRLGKSLPRLLRGLPAALGRAGRAAWAALKKLPAGVVRCVKGIPQFCRDAGNAVLDLARWIWAAIAAVPAALQIAWQWIAGTAARIGTAVASAFGAVVSFFHSLGIAIFTWFRAVTLADLLHALAAIPRGIVSLAQTAWAGLASLGRLSHDLLKKLFGSVGEVLWYIGKGIWWVVMYVPKNLGRATKRLGEWFGQAGREVRVWIDPKAV